MTNCTLKQYTYVDINLNFDLIIRNYNIYKLYGLPTNWNYINVSESLLRPSVYTLKRSKNGIIIENTFQTQVFFD